jgi:hypothetical protein
LSRLGTAFDTEVVGIAEAIGKAEMFFGCRLAVDDLGSGFLGAEHGYSAGLLDRGNDSR